MKLYSKEDIKNCMEYINKCKDFFCFEPEINNIDDLIENTNKVVSVTHKDCNHTETMTLLEWLSCHISSKNKINKIKTDCPKCLTSKIERKVKLLYNDEFKLTETIYSAPKYIKVEHKNCGFEFYISFKKFISGEVICPQCIKNNKLNSRPNINKKNKWFLDKLEKDKLCDFRTY